jgi:RecA-family ATPase
MSLAEVVDDRPEIDAATFAKIDAWRDLIVTSRLVDRLPTYRAAATELFRRALHETSMVAFKSIEEDIELLGSDYAELPIETVYGVMRDALAEARLQGGFVKNGSAKESIGEEPPPALDPNDYADAVPATIVPAALTTPIAWPQEAPPPIDWLAASRIPRGDVTTLSGDGGAGKTDIALQLAANVARGAVDWLGHEIANGPVVLVSGEEPEREIRRRLWLHATRGGYSFSDLADLHQWFPDKSGDAVLAVPELRSGIMRPTRLMHEISAAIEAIAPVLVITDNVAATFAGEQNNRVMARSFVNLWRAVARGPGSPAVLLLDHPSLSGLTNNTGRGGSMDWRNAVRSALYLKPSEDKAESDQGIRILETAKSNYGPPGRPIRLQWSDGGLQLEHAPTSLHRLAKDQACDEIFLRLLDERNAQGRYVGENPGKNYAPAVFAEMAGNGNHTRQAFAKAMERLFSAKPPHIALCSRKVDGKPRQYLDRAPQP